MTEPATHEGRTRVIATLLLLAMTATWGSTFFLIKDLVEHVPSADFLVVRFAIAAIAMCLVFHKQVRALSRRAVAASALLGGVYGSAQLLQTVGLEHTSASVSGFVKRDSRSNLLPPRLPAVSALPPEPIGGGAPPTMPPPTPPRGFCPFAAPGT